MSYNRRVTYLLRAKDETVQVGALNNGNEVYIKDTFAAKQVRVRNVEAAKEAPGVSITWSASQHINSPFHPPAEQGLRIYLSISEAPDLQWEDFTAWLKQCNIPLKPSTGPINVNSTLIYYSEPSYSLQDLRKNTCLKQYGVDAHDLLAAMRISLDMQAGLASVREANSFYRGINRTEIVTKSTLHSRTEVGFFSKHRDAEKFDAIYTGRTRLIGLPNQSKPVVIHDIPQHRLFDTQANFTLSNPQGLHPDILLSLPKRHPYRESPSLGHELGDCKLYAKIDLPREAFFDRFQLQDSGTNSYRCLGVWGNTDLEAPEWVLDSGSTALFELREFDKAVWNYKIPMHLRYATPGDTEYQHGQIPAPSVFWACTDRSLDSQDYDNLGYPLVFGENTAMLHYDTASILVLIPRLRESDGSAVTNLSVVIMFLGLLAVLLSIFRGPAVGKHDFALKSKRKPADECQPDAKQR